MGARPTRVARERSHLWRRLAEASAVTLLLLLLLMPTASMANRPPGRGGNFGLGGIIGNPTGLTGKIWTGYGRALDFHLATDHFGRHDSWGLYGDYLFHFDTGVRNRHFALPLYLGPGLAVHVEEHYWVDREGRRVYHDESEVLLMLRMVFGVSFLFKRFNGEAFAELVADFQVVPALHASPRRPGTAVGFRYYF